MRVFVMMAREEERYEDCEQCGERFVGEDAIASYLRSVECTPGGLDERICIGCVKKRELFEAACEAEERFTLDELEAHAESIRCPRCGRVSYHPEDVRTRYCGACHLFHDDARRLDQ